jgi:hypothetical protein
MKYKILIIIFIFGFAILFAMYFPTENFNNTKTNKDQLTNQQLIQSDLLVGFYVGYSTDILDSINVMTLTIKKQEDKNLYGYLNTKDFSEKLKISYNQQLAEIKMQGTQSNYEFFGKLNIDDYGLLRINNKDNENIKWTFVKKN